MCKTIDSPGDNQNCRNRFAYNLCTQKNIKQSKNCDQKSQEQQQHLKRINKNIKMSEKISLLEKYSIPVERLDYRYIGECNNIKELVQILEILRSGEEGFYPDLNKFTESKLMELDPCNRSLATEIPCKRIDANERKEINVSKCFFM